jgi:hypothetical protein
LPVEGIANCIVVETELLSNLIELWRTCAIEKSNVIRIFINYHPQGDM